MARVEEVVAAPAVRFAVVVEAVGVGEVVGGGGGGCGAGGGAMRVALAGALLAGAPAGGGFPEQVLLAALCVAGSGGSAIEFNTSSCVNTAGGALAGGVGELMDVLGGGGGGSGAARRQMRRRAEAAPQEAAELALQPLSAADAAAIARAAPRGALLLAFNLLARSSGEAAAAAAALSDGGGAPLAAAAEALANATGRAAGSLSLSVPPASISFITLTFRRSRWAMLWDWVRAHVGSVLGGGIALLAVGLFWAGLRSRGRGRRCWGPEVGRAARRAPPPFTRPPAAPQPDPGARFPSAAPETSVAPAPWAPAASKWAHSGVSTLDSVSAAHSTDEAAGSPVEDPQGAEEEGAAARARLMAARAVKLREAAQRARGRQQQRPQRAAP
jgi:hypothetical protein